MYFGLLSAHKLQYRMEKDLSEQSNQGKGFQFLVLHMDGKNFLLVTSHRGPRCFFWLKTVWCPVCSSDDFVYWQMHATGVNAVNWIFTCCTYLQQLTCLDTFCATKVHALVHCNVIKACLPMKVDSKYLLIVLFNTTITLKIV